MTCNPVAENLDSITSPGGSFITIVANKTRYKVFNGFIGAAWDEHLQAVRPAVGTLLFKTDKIDITEWQEGILSWVEGWRYDEYKRLSMN